MTDTRANVTKTILEKHIYRVLPAHIVEIFSSVPGDELVYLTEIRLRINQPLLLVLGNRDIILSPTGKIISDYDGAYLCTRDDLHKILQLISRNSLYAYEQEMKMGFLTIDGGHRIGLAGQVIADCGEIKTLKSIASVNIRLAREIIGCAEKIMPYIINGGRSIFSTLIISPPRCGKTTILRDLIRRISTGDKVCAGLQVGVVDERSEIAACKNGVTTVDLGKRTDVLDRCPKAIGMLMLIRSMSPSVVATDELGRDEDVSAVREALNAGVSVLATVHGRDVNDLLQRPHISSLINYKDFDRYVVLSNIPHVGTVERIIDSKENLILWEKE